MKQAVIYTRVSTDDQAKTGYSLIEQKVVLEQYAKIKNINILTHYEEDYSAKNFDRPEFIKLKEYCKANKKSIDLFLFTRWDRFSRDVLEAHKMLEWFNNQGIHVDSVEQPLDIMVPDDNILLTMNLFSPNVWENFRN